MDKKKIFGSLKKYKLSGTIRPHRYPEMDQEKELLRQRELVLQELAHIEAKLKIVRLFKSEQQKEISSPSSSQSKDENIGTSSSGKQKVISSPSSSQSKDEASPAQTETGKGISNPLMVVDLPKIQTEVQTSITLVKPSDLNLRPNGGTQIPKPKDLPLVSSQMDEGIQKPKKNYYVVYNGPNAGIYENWNTTKLATEGVSNVKHKRFSSFLENKVSGDIFTRTNMLPELHLIQSSEGLKPNNFREALKAKRKNNGNPREEITLVE